MGKVPIVTSYSKNMSHDDDAQAMWLFCLCTYTSQSMYSCCKAIYVFTLSDTLPLKEWVCAVSWANPFMRATHVKRLIGDTSFMLDRTNQYMKNHDRCVATIMCWCRCALCHYGSYLLQTLKEQWHLSWKSTTHVLLDPPSLCEGYTSGVTIISTSPLFCTPVPYLLG